MCYAIYIASNNECPVLEWDESNPGFYLEPLDERQKIASKQFTKPHIYYAGSHEGCGCGFFTDPDYHDEDDNLEQAKKSIASLIDLLKAQLKASSEIELFVCWEGDENKRPKRKLRMNPEDLRSQPLPLQELDFIIFSNT